MLVIGEDWPYVPRVFNACRWLLKPVAGGAGR
jgi:hypothetical protein